MHFPAGQMSPPPKIVVSPQGLSAGLSDEPTIPPNLYRLPAEPLSADVLIPAFRQATSVRGAFGWFSAGWIHSLSAGLAVYLKRTDVQPMEFTIAPAVFSTERAAFERAVLSPEAPARRVEEEILLAAQPGAGAMANHSVAFRERLMRLAPSEPPEQADYERAVAKSENVMIPTPVRRIFVIPRGVEWRSGKYSQQGEAVYAWESAGRRGILAMATGAGKTIAALICAYRAWQEHDGPFLLVASAPTTALVIQWNTESQRF